MEMTRAFVYYSRLVGNRACGFPLDVYISIKGACGNDRALALDIWAANECLLILEILNKKETLDILRTVYLEPFSKRPLRSVKKNEISTRILHYAVKNHLDERTVYRHLNKACVLWQNIREYGSP